MTTEFLNNIYNQVKKLTVLISALIGTIYSIIFQLFYLNDTSNLFIFTIVGIFLSVILSIRFPEKKDKKFYITLFKYILIGIIFGFISELITDHLVFFGAFIGLYFGTKKKTNPNEFSFKKYAWNQFKQ